MITPDTVAREHPEVTVTTLNIAESALLHIGTRTYSRPNETVSRIWHLMSEGLTMGEIGNRVEAQLEVTTDMVQVLEVQRVLMAIHP